MGLDDFKTYENDQNDLDTPKLNQKEQQGGKEAVIGEIESYYEKSVDELFFSGDTMHSIRVTKDRHFKGKYLVKNSGKTIGIDVQIPTIGEIDKNGDAIYYGGFKIYDIELDNLEDFNAVFFLINEALINSKGYNVNFVLGKDDSIVGKRDLIFGKGRGDDTIKSDKIPFKDKGNMKKLVNLLNLLQEN